MNEPVPLELAIDTVAGASHVRVTGEVDLTNAARLEAAVAAAGDGHVILDVAALAYVDSAGIRAIDRGHRELAGQGRSLVIVSPPETRAAWTFRIAGFGDGIVVETLDAALASLPSGPTR